MTQRTKWHVTVPAEDGEVYVTAPEDVTNPVAFTVKGGRVSTDEAGAQLLARAYPDAIADPPPAAEGEALPPELAAATTPPPDVAGTPGSPGTES